MTALSAWIATRPVLSIGAKMTVGTGTTCSICGIDLPPLTGRGRPRKLCGQPVCVAADRSARRAAGKPLRDRCLWCNFELPPARRTNRKFCPGTSCQKDFEWSLRRDDQMKARPARSIEAMENDYAQELEAALQAAGFSVDKTMAEAELEFGNCVIHKAHYEPSPARKGKVLDGSCDFDPELFRSEDGSLPEWLAEFLVDFPRSGAAVGFTVRALGGSWAEWELKPGAGRTLGSM